MQTILQRYTKDIPRTCQRYDKDRPKNQRYNFMTDIYTDTLSKEL